MSGVKAKAIIADVLADVLSPGVPPSYRTIISARIVGSGKARKLRASLVMFDGRPAEVEAWQWAQDCWAHQWLRLDGGPIDWNGAQWVRTELDLAAAA